MDSVVTILRAEQDRIVKRRNDCKQLYVDSLQEQVNRIVFQPECGGDIGLGYVSRIWSLDDRKCLNFQQVVKLEQTCLHGQQSLRFPTTGVFIFLSSKDHTVDEHSISRMTPIDS